MLTSEVKLMFSNLRVCLLVEKCKKYVTISFPIKSKDLVWFAFKIGKGKILKVKKKKVSQNRIHVFQTDQKTTKNSFLVFRKIRKLESPVFYENYNNKHVLQ